ncbi:MAG TPA: hypothetical protein VE988_20000 [Gemmataceae bacterium]|nr:hypothetical protein [Gemmataceae bacterium]
MLCHSLRIAIALATLTLLAQAPCLAQNAPDPTTSDKPAVEESSISEPRYHYDDWFPHRFPPLDQDIDPPPPSYAAQFWELISEVPSHHSGYGQPTGFGFNSPAVPTVGYHVTWFPDANVANQNATLNAVRQDFHVGIPVWTDERQMIGLTTSVRSVLYNTNAMLPGITQPFPEDLWDVRFGANYRYLFLNGWSAGGTVTFGSASDRPFASVNELTAGVSAFLRIPVGEHNAWLFSLMYSPTGELNFPFPGVAFYWQPSDWFNATIGVPFHVMWRPVQDVTLEASYMPLTNVTGKASWHVWGGISLYAAYNSGNESYFIYGSPNSQDRLFYYDQRVTGGVKLQIGRQCAVDLSSGYAFNRYFFEGQTSSDRNNRIDVADSPFLSLSVELRY